jgi:hypothetical protein
MTPHQNWLSGKVLPRFGQPKRPELFVEIRVFSDGRASRTGAVSEPQRRKSGKGRPTGTRSRSKMNHLEVNRIRWTLLLGGLAFAASAVAQSSSSMPDAQIEANVLRALASAPDLSTQNIQSSTVYGTVTLTGNVHDDAMRTEAENLAARASGVKKVVDELALGDTPAPQADASAAPQQGVAQPPNGGELQSDGSYAPAPPQPPQDAANGAPPMQDQNAPYTPQPPQANSPNNNQYPGGYGPPQGNPPANAQTAPPDNGQYPGGYGPPQGNPPANAQAAPPDNGQYPGGYGPPQDQSPAQAQAQPYGAPPSGPPARRPMYQNGIQNYAPPGGQQAGLQVTIPSGSMLRIRINRGLDSNHIQPGAQFDGTVLSDVAADGAIAIPRGATVQGTVVDAKKAGVLKGQGQLGLAINSVTLGGVVYPLDTQLWQQQGRDKSTTTVNSALGLGALGAIFGAVAGGGAGAAIGAGVGGAAGVAGSAASPSGRVVIPPEAVLTFQLAQPAVVKTVSEQEMARLAYAAGPTPPPQPQMRRYYSPYYGYYYAPY